MRIWIDNVNVVRGLEERLGVERADAVWAVAENWRVDSQELEPNWRVQLGVGADGDLWEAMDLLLERIEGKVEVYWVVLGIPQSGPSSNHVVCRQLGRVEGQLPSWMSRGPSQRRQLWKMNEDTVKVQCHMALDKV